MEKIKDKCNFFSERNKKIIEFFKSKNINIRIFGDFKKPSIIFNNDICLSCYVKNNNLIFTDKPFNSKNLFFINLSNIVIDDKLFFYWLENSQHRAIYTIYFQVYEDIDEKLFITNFDKDINGNPNPIFSKFNPKIYFGLESAKSIVDKFSTKLIKLKIINSD